MVVQRPLSLQRHGARSRGGVPLDSWHRRKRRSTAEAASGTSVQCRQIAHSAAMSTRWSNLAIARSVARNPLRIADLVRPPAVNAAFFASCMVTDAPTSPPCRRDRVRYAIIVAVPGTRLFLMLGAIRFLPDGADQQPARQAGQRPASTPPPVAGTTATQSTVRPDSFPRAVAPRCAGWVAEDCYAPTAAAVPHARTVVHLLSGAPPVRLVSRASGARASPWGVRRTPTAGPRAG